MTLYDGQQCKLHLLPFTTSFAASDSETSVVGLGLTSELDVRLPMGIPYSIRLELSLSLEKSDVFISVREDDVE